MMLATGVHLYPSVYQLFSLNLNVIVNLHQTIHKVQIYFVFLSVGNPKTVLKGGYVGWKGGSSSRKLWIQRGIERFAGCAYDCA